MTNIFRNTEVRIAFKPTNTIYQQLTEKTHNNSSSGIYEIKCNTCNMKYVGQSGRHITTRYKEHIRYIRTNNKTSAYATHILNNRLEYGTAENTLKLIHPCSKGQRMNVGKIYIYKYTANRIDSSQNSKWTSLIHFTNWHYLQKQRRQYTPDHRTSRYNAGTHKQVNYSRTCIIGANLYS